MVWFLLALVLLPVVLLFLVGGRENDEEADPVAHYRRQLLEIEEDRKKRVLSKKAAAAAKLEVERRILKLADYQEARENGSRSPFSIPLVLSLLVVVGSFLLYQKLGKPTVPSQRGRAVDMLDTPVSKDGPTYGEAIVKLTNHLRENPDDRQGWEVLAKSSRSVGSFAVAADAFEELIRLQPANLNWRVQQLEAYVAQARGQVTPAANLLIQQLVQLEPGHPAAHYYIGLARLQGGESEAAQAIWIALSDRSPANAPWMPMVREQLAALGATPSKLTKEEMAQVAAMSAEDRQAFVRSMIARLEERLESNPKDAEGWLMLARSQAAMGETDTAIKTLTAALELVTADKRPILQAFLDNLKENTNS